LLLFSLDSVKFSDDVHASVQSGFSCSFSFSFVDDLHDALLKYLRSGFVVLEISTNFDADKPKVTIAGCLFCFLNLNII